MGLQLSTTQPTPPETLPTDEPTAQERDSPDGQPLKPRPASVFTPLPTTLIYAGTFPANFQRLLGATTRPGHQRCPDSDIKPSDEGNSDEKSSDEDLLDFNRAQLPPTPAPAAVHKSTTNARPTSASDRPESEGRVTVSKSTDFSTSTVPTTPSTTTTSDDTHTGDHNLVKNVPDAATTCPADPRPRERPRINRSRPPDARVHPLAERPAKTYKPAKTTLPPVQLPPGRLYDAESFAFAAGGKPCGDRTPQVRELDSLTQEIRYHTRGRRRTTVNSNIPAQNVTWIHPIPRCHVIIEGSRTPELPGYKTRGRPVLASVYA